MLNFLLSGPPFASTVHFLTASLSLKKVHFFSISFWMNHTFLIQKGFPYFCWALLSQVLFIGVSEGKKDHRSLGFTTRWAILL